MANEIRYTFDVPMTATVYVTATSEEEAKRKVFKLNGLTLDHAAEIRSDQHESLVLHQVCVARRAEFETIDEEELTN